MVTADAIAVAVANPATTAPAASAPATPAADKATAPLAIAAAAIAASASLASETAPATPAAEGDGDTGTTQTAAANAKTDGAKINAARRRRPGRQHDGRLLPIPPSPPVLHRPLQRSRRRPRRRNRTVQIKTAVVAKEGAATTGEQDGAAGTHLRSRNDRCRHRRSLRHTADGSRGQAERRERHGGGREGRRVRQYATLPAAARQHAFGHRRCRPNAGQFFRQRPAGRRRDPDAAAGRFDRICPRGPTHRHRSDKRRGAAERACDGDRRIRQQRQEPLRNPARSGRTRPHRCPHRCRSPRPGDVASDGRTAGNAVDAAPGRQPVAARAGQCRTFDRQ